MPRIILRFKDKNLKAFPLNKQCALTIGRRGDNHVVIENLAVSGHHAKIIPHEKGYVLADLKSKNGTFVNGRRIKTYLLKHKDVVTVGKHLLIYDQVGQMKQTADQAKAEHPSAAEAVMASTDQTMFMDTRHHRQLLGRGDAKADLSQNKARPAAFLSFLGGRCERMDISAKLQTTIGKGTQSDIVITGLFGLLAGNPAATINQTRGNFYLNPIGGLIKPKLNGKTIKESVKLNPEDQLQVGGLKMQFHLDANFSTN